MRAGPSQEEIRRHNLGALLRHVHRARADLAGRADQPSWGSTAAPSGRSPPTSTAAGLVSEELPRETGRAGRPSLVVRPESARVYVVRVRRRGRPAARPPGSASAAWSSTAGRPYRPRGCSAATRSSRRWPAFVRQMQQQVPADAVCVGARRRGLRHGAPATTAWSGSARNLGWVDEPLGEALRRRARRCGLPVAVGNDADLAALAEHTRGVGGRLRQRHLPARRRRRRRRHHRRRPPARPGTAATAARSATWWSTRDGRPCGCGSRGCWETEIGEHALLRAAGRCDGTGAATRCGPWSTPPTGATPWRRRRCARSATGSASGVANLVNIFNPEMVDLRRHAARRLPRLGRPGAQPAQPRSRLPACREHVRLRTPTLGDDAALIGAAELAFERLLADPLDVG